MNRQERLFRYIEENGPCSIYDAAKWLYPANRMDLVRRDLAAMGDKISTTGERAHDGTAAWGLSASFVAKIKARERDEARRYLAEIMEITRDAISALDGDLAGSQLKAAIQSQIWLLNRDPRDFRHCAIVKALRPLLEDDTVVRKAEVA